MDWKLLGKATWQVLAPLFSLMALGIVLVCLVAWLGIYVIPFVFVPGLIGLAIYGRYHDLKKGV